MLVATRTGKMCHYLVPHTVLDVKHAFNTLSIRYMSRQVLGPQFAGRLLGRHQGFRLTC